MSLRERLEKAAEQILDKQEIVRQQGGSMYEIRLTPQQERDIQAALDRQTNRKWRNT